jgi:hypothetical protein
MKKIIILAMAVICTVGMNAQILKTKKDKKVEVVKSKEKEMVIVAPISKDPSIFLEKDVVDYGVIDKGAEGTRTFKVTNKGSQPLLLTNCSGSCGCTVPTCPREPILPGKSAEISVKYDTNRPGPINKQVNIASNDPQNPNKVVMIKGEVKDVAAPAAAPAHN